MARSATTSPCTGRSRSASRRSSPRWPACFTSGGTVRSRRSDLGLDATIDLLIIAVIGGLGRLEGAWLGAFAFIVINNYVRDIQFPCAEEGAAVVGGSFNTMIGIVFLLIVLVSPDGLMGIWDRLLKSCGARPRRQREPAEAARAGEGSSR